ncbi:peroxidase-like [Cydia pomonella]|uniref:peroxidase-like n=1 Tax=Cydia pomonella TaxID=82600 RepID=UPI002ADE51B7|nr:peroxidase-like [Cydia pomonella]
MMLLMIIFILILRAIEGALYDTFTGERLTPQREADVRRLNLIPWCALEVADCQPNERRRMDYSCNNPRYPPRGATLTPYYRLLPPVFGRNYTARPAKDGAELPPLTPSYRLLPPVFGRNYSARPAKDGAELPHVRDIRVAIISDGRRSSEHYTQLTTHIGVFLTGDVTSLHDTVNYVIFTTDCCTPAGAIDPRCIPIRVANDDVHLRRSNVRCLNLTAPITYQMLGCAPASLPPSRVDVFQINTSPPMIDLSIVYGNNEADMRKGKAGVGGRIKTEVLKGKEWPPSGETVCLLNKPQLGETRCHNSANLGINSIVGANLFGLWFIRNHNQIARRLEELNPCWSDDQLFAEARDVNIAVGQQTIFYELMPSLMGYDFLLKQGAIFNTYGHVDDYDEELEPRLSIEFVMAYRWFHTMQEGRLRLIVLYLEKCSFKNRLAAIDKQFQIHVSLIHRMYDNSGRVVDERNIVDYTLRTGALPVNDTIEKITQGAFRQPAAASDNIVDPDVGERILGDLQFVSDVVSSDIMKYRALGLPSYNEYRQLCGLHTAKDFDDLRHWMKEEQVSSLQTSYRDVDDIDLHAGMISEQPMPGAAVGPTLACILVLQMKRWRTSDRFWYENSVHPGSFTEEQLFEIRKSRIARLLCDHGEGVDSIQPYPFLMPGPGNEIVKCSEIPAMNMYPWKDEACSKDKHLYEGKTTVNGYYSQFSDYLQKLFVQT